MKQFDSEGAVRDRMGATRDLMEALWDRPDSPTGQKQWNYIFQFLSETVKTEHFWGVRAIDEP